MEDEPDIKTLNEIGLSHSLGSARTSPGGLSINEVADIIAEHFSVSELRSLISSLQGIIDVADTENNKEQ